MERYRSGHNEAVLKTVCPKGRVGSNPTLSVRKPPFYVRWFSYAKRTGFGEVPKWLKGLPWKGSRSLIAVRGFKSLLLRLLDKKSKSFLKKVLTTQKKLGIITKLSERHSEGLEEWKKVLDKLYGSEI